MRSRRFPGLAHRYLASYPAWLVVSETAISAHPPGTNRWTVRREQTEDVAFRWRFVGSVLEVHPDDYSEAPLIVFRPLRRRPLEEALQELGWPDLARR